MSHDQPQTIPNSRRSRLGYEAYVAKLHGNRYRESLNRYGSNYWYYSVVRNICYIHNNILIVQTQ